MRTLSAGTLTIVGPADKARDYAAAGGAIVLALIAFIAMFELFEWLRRNVSPLTITSLQQNLILANIPAVFAASGLLFATRIDVVIVLYSTVAETVLLSCLFGRMLRNRQAWAVALNFNWVLPFLGFGLLAGALTVPSWAALLAATTQWPIETLGVATISSVLAKLSLIGCGILSVIVFSQADVKSIARYGCLALGLAQACLLAGAVRLIGPLIKTGTSLDYLLQVSLFGALCLGVLMIASIVRTLRASAAAWRLPDALPNLANGSLLNPVAVALAAITLKVSFDLPTFHLLDDYHTGEAALPFWALIKFHMLPYVDLSPARGWVNLVYGAFGELMFRPGWVNYGFMAPYLAFCVYVFLFVALRSLTGPWLAFFLVCIAPAPNNLSEIDLVITGLLAAICISSLKLRPATWLILWVILGTVAVLFAPGQGGLLVLATAFLGAFRFVEAVRGDRAVLLRNLALLACLGGVLYAFTPLGAMIGGAIRYGLEQSSANTAMNGIAWRPSAHGLLWEIFRISWIIVTIGIGIAVYLGIRQARPATVGLAAFLQPRTLNVIIGVPIFLLGVLFIPRAAGRIDPGEISRLGFASLWFLTILLPLYAFMRSPSGNSRRVAIALASAALAGAFAPLVNYSWSMNPFDRMMAVDSPADVQHGEQAGLPRLGAFLWDPEWVKKRAALKAFLDANIAASDTFLDLTNRSGLYYLFDRRPPIEGAVYNLTNVNQEKRAIAALVQRPPALALAGPDAVLHDGAPVGLRSPLLFRYVIENYRPIEGGGGIWLKPSSSPGESPDLTRSQQELDLLTTALVLRDLGALPRTWGKVWNRLAPQLALQRTVAFTGAGLHDASQSADGAITAQGPDPFAVVDLSRLDVVGSDMGIISFNFECLAATPASALELFWTTEQAPSVETKRSVSFHAHNGRVVVPVDAFPAWVLGGKITSLRFDLVDRASCGSWRIADLALSQRSDLQELRRASRP
ncbi:MAG TPA: hypothetical protein VGC77_10245 [Rhodopseudomonas sp.]|uniref:hypothetical protein n=1 Tax=Rhodopseudomonas sp. TaxID=1078 RepID=UPI002ED98700